MLMRVGKINRVLGWAMLLAALAVFAQPATAQSLSASNQTKLLELSEILGAVHHLRALCEVDEAQTWRQSMIKLIETQDAPEWLADQMIKRFNTGYHREEANYPACDAASQRRAVRLANQGARLARSLSRG